MKTNIFLLLVTVAIFNSHISKAQKTDIPIEKKVEIRIQNINNIIKNKNLRWKAGKTSISFLSKEQFILLCSESYDSSMVQLNLINQDSLYNIYLSKHSKKTIPKVFSIPDWESLMSTIEEQECGNCWAHAATGVAEGILHYNIGTNIDIDLDEEYLTDAASCGSCSGSSSLNCGLSYIKNHSCPK